MKQIKTLFARLRPGPITVLIGAIVAAAALVMSRPQRPAIEIPEKAWSVDVIPAVPSAIRPTLELYARIESPQDARLSAAVEADILVVLVQDGDTVAAGDELLVLDDRDARFELLQRDADVQEIRAQINLEEQRLRRNKESLFKERELLELTVSNAERARSLYKDNLVSLSNVDDTAEELKRQELAVTSRQLIIEESDIRKQQLTAQLQRAKALRDKAQLSLDRTRLVAPFAGVISEVDASVGDRVRIGDELMRLHNPEALELRTQVPTRFAARVRDALSAGVRIGANAEFSGADYPAVLTRLSGQTREGSGSVDAYLVFDAPPQEAPLGSTVPVLLSLPAEVDVIAVPAEALYGRNRVYKLAGDRMAAVDVDRVGERVSADGRSEVLIRSSQLTSDDRIITTKVSSATNGLLVRIRQGGPGDSDAMLAAGEGRPGS
ncbi:MAG: HlyD family efflux transporter periplasmic adaptor subunit [Chromatiales bacterium]|nr:MAG: HlyD family efflux transporter periplasmic adaptor subunit [Chromatiales bacterium]